MPRGPEQPRPARTYLPVARASRPGRVGPDAHVAAFRPPGRTMVAGKPASRLIERLATADRREIQHLLARATGNFKHGNERDGTRRQPGHESS